VEGLRLWYMNVSASDVQMVTVGCWLFVAVCMAALVTLIIGRH